MAGWVAGACGGGAWCCWVWLWVLTGLVRFRVLIPIVRGLTRRPTGHVHLRHPFHLLKEIRHPALPTAPAVATVDTPLARWRIRAKALLEASRVHNDHVHEQLRALVEAFGGAYHAGPKGPRIQGKADSAAIS